MKKLIIILLIISLIIVSYSNYLKYKNLDSLFTQIYYPIGQEKVPFDKESIVKFIDNKDFLVSYKKSTNTYTIRHTNKTNVKNHNLVSIKFDGDNLSKIYFLEYESKTYFSFYTKDFQDSPYKIEYTPNSSIDSQNVNSVKAQRDYLIQYINYNKNYLYRLFNKSIF